MSGFITKPPAASTTAPARTTPMVSKDFHSTPTTSPEGEVTRWLAPVS